MAKYSDDDKFIGLFLSLPHLCDEIKEIQDKYGITTLAEKYSKADTDLETVCYAVNTIKLLIRQLNEICQENDRLAAENVEIRSKLRRGKSNGGRHAKFSAAECQAIKDEYGGGKLSMQQLADKHECSKGLIHKLIHSD